MLKEMSAVVKEVGNLLVNLRGDISNLKGKWKEGQFKIKADLIAHNALAERLKKLEPHIPIISEEDASSLTLIRPEHYWLIDPIDGTASFAHGYDGYVTQVALMKHGIPYISVIYAPELDLLFSAIRGKGAFLNNNKIKRLVDSKATSIVDNTHKPRGIAYSIYKEFNLNKYVECGSISFKICNVANGTVDIFVKDIVVKDWDLAAPQLVIEESGGFISDIKGNIINYYGGYGHSGIIVARSKRIGEDIIKWYIRGVR